METKVTEIDLPRFLTEQNKEVCHAIQLAGQAKIGTLKVMAAELVEWSASRTWCHGYSVLSATFNVRTTDYDRRAGMSITVAVEKDPTVNQYCYQFVKMADELRLGVIEREAELDRIKNSFAYKFFNFFCRGKK